MGARGRPNLAKSSLHQRIWGSGPDADSQDFSQKIFQFGLALIVTLHMTILLMKIFE
jgi:hypothetical protein